MIGSAGGINVQGEVQQKLDVYADQALVHCLGVRENVAIIASEESEEAITFDGRDGPGKYVVVFDPLDGSSNIDVNVSVGTIFSILGLPEGAKSSDDPSIACLQPGIKQLAAGYVVYGSSTIMVYTTGHGVHGFTLDPSFGAYVLSHENIRMPEQGNYYSSNDAYWDTFPKPYQDYSAISAVAEWGDVMPCGISDRWSRTFIARCCVVACSFTRRPTRTRKENSVCCTRRILWRLSQSRLVAVRALAPSESWKSNQPRFTNARR